MVKIRNRNQNRNFPKVGTETGYGSTTLQFTQYGCCLLPRHQCFSLDTRGLEKNINWILYTKFQHISSSFRKSLRPSRQNIQLFKTCIFFSIFLLLRFLAFRDPDPDSDTDPVSESLFLTHRPSWIRIRNVAGYIEWSLRFSKATSSN